MRLEHPGAGVQAPVTILKPLHGSEPGLLENLESFCRQDYAAPLQIVFGVHDAADPAIQVVRTLQAKYPALDMVLVADTARHGSNGKISNLINMQAAAKHDVLVLADSDIAVTPRWLAQQPQLLRALDELRGRDLVCFCAPCPCHGDLLLRLANATRASPGGAPSRPQLERQRSAGWD